MSKEVSQSQKSLKKKKKKVCGPYPWKSPEMSLNALCQISYFNNWMVFGLALLGG